MKLNKYRKGFLIIALAAFMVLLLFSNTVFAEINQHYVGSDAVPDVALDEAYEQSTFLELLAKLIYALGRFFEWILGTIFRLLTGYSDFPWADKIVFNSVPLLDVNFLNPGGGSFVERESIQNVLKNLYATIFTLATTFFGLVVLITAVKLVISTIATDKAKYKKAIVDWLVGFVMLFCIHYAISFIFYLNEQLVLVASRLVKSQLNETNEMAQAKSEQLFETFVKSVESSLGEQKAKILKDNPNITMTWMNALASNDTSKGLQEGFMKKQRWYLFGADTAKNTQDQYRALIMLVSWAADENISVTGITEIRNNIKLFKQISNTSYIGAQGVETSELKKLFTDSKGNFDETNYNYFVQHLDGIEETVKGKSSGDGTYHCELQASGVGYIEQKETYVGKDYYILSEGAKVMDSNISGNIDATNWYWTQVLDDMAVLKSASNTRTGEYVEGTAGSLRLVSDLASYFRDNSYEKEMRTTNVTGVKNGKNIEIQNMIMYAILVVQSLILFIAYVKRLFYVILLAMMAPVVVAVDFFQKFGK